ncbi:MAG: metallophosphoesterase, partial [Deltaproteobacteria bacterium]|nr:metallophosphoesterase [Deltaproteobacteria bacterium]
KARQRLFVIPGNHDVDRDKIKYLRRTLETIEEANDFFAPQSADDRKPYFARFHAYEEFFNRYFEGIRKCNVEQHYYAELLDLPHIPIRLGIVGLNSALFCQDHDDERKLWIGERVCDAAFNSLAQAGSADLIIVLHHHPYSWLHRKEMRCVKGLLTEKADVCLYGHLHEPETEEIKDQHGKVLRFQSGANYDGSRYPYRVLWGIVDLQAGKVRIRPMTYQEGPPRHWTLDTSLFPHKAPDYTEDFDLPRLIQQRTSGLPLCDPAAFFSGGLPTEADIAADLDVLRTQYIKTWTDEKGQPKKAWKDVLFTQASGTSKKKIRVVIVYGHRGSGKTTLCKRMMHDLKTSSTPIVDLLADPLAPGHVDGILTQIRVMPEKCLHVFTEIEGIEERIVVLQLLASLKRLADSKMALTIYISIDTNKWRQIEAKIGSNARAMGCLLESRHLRGQLDERELSDLISRLKSYNCLFRLEHKTDEAIRFLFRRKAKRGLLTSLIEATRGTEEGQELADILWQEFQGLSNKAKWAYGLVMLFSALGIAVPYSVMEGALRELTGDQGYFESEAFNAETAEIVYRPSRAAYSSRHRLVSETLLQRFTGVEWDGFKYRLLYATLRSLVLSIPLHRTFFEMALDRKVLRVVTDLKPLIQNVKEGRISSIQGHDISRVLNSVIRIYQGQGKHQEGEQLANESLKHWDHIGNQASYLRAFCCYHLGETTEVRKAVLELVEATDYPFHVLHGIALLRMLRDWTAADKALKAFEKSMDSDAALYPNYHQLRQEVDLGLSVKWSDADIDSLKPSMSLNKIEYILVDSGTDERTVIAQYKRLISRQHDFFKGYLSFFSYLHRLRAEEHEDMLLERYRVLQHECEYHLGQHDGHYRNYPKDVRSLLHSNMARALFKIDYILKNGYQHREACAEHFLKALSLKADNWYAHNWYGTFLKEAIRDRGSARTHYEHAVNGNKSNPVFKHNLALLYYEAPTFSKHGLEKAQKLLLDTLSLCTADPQWEGFRHYPEELLASLSLLLVRTDFKDGDPLDADKSLLPDAD